MGKQSRRQKSRAVSSNHPCNLQPVGATNAAAAATGTRKATTTAECSEDHLLETVFNNVPWLIYTRLSTKYDTMESIPECIQNKIAGPLSDGNDEFDQIDFSKMNWEDCLLIFLRACAWYNTLLDPAITIQERELFKSKLILLLGRSSLHLAALSHQDNLHLPIPKTAKTELMSRCRNSSFQIYMSYCLDMAINFKAKRSLALTLLARACIGQIAQDHGVYARPGMPDAWLSAAECELMLAEMEATIHASDATGIRPADRRGPWVIEEAIREGKEFPPEIAEEMNIDNWEVSVPLVTDATGQTYLAEYWWGISLTAAGYIASQLLLNTIRHLERYRSLAQASSASHQLWKRYHDLQRELERRGAAALASLDVATTAFATDGSNPKHLAMREMVVELRHFFSGTPFEPTEEFVKNLPIKHSLDPTPEEKFNWMITCMFGAGGKNRTGVTVIDNSESQYQGFILKSKTFDGPNPDEHYNPPAKVIYKEVLLKAMAGAGDEERCHSGNPRRPHSVLVSYRLRDIKQELSALLEHVGVKCVLNTKDSLGFACANNQTDVDTGMPLNLLDEEKQSTLSGTPSSIVGQIVGVYGLVSRKDLNGRIGRVMKWIEDEGRWQLKLVNVLCSESRGKLISIKPDNLMSVPEDIYKRSVYIDFQEEIRSWTPGYQLSDECAMTPILERFQGLQNVEPKDICAICQEAFETKPDEDGLFDGKGTRLPCDHCFHIHCLLRWIGPQKMFCPCCRSPL